MGAQGRWQRQHYRPLVPGSRESQHASRGKNDSGVLPQRADGRSKGLFDRLDSGLSKDGKDQPASSRDISTQLSLQRRQVQALIESGKINGAPLEVKEWAQRAGLLQNIKTEYDEFRD